MSLPLTSVSSVSFFVVLILNHTDSGFGWFNWRLIHTESAAHAKHYTQLCVLFQK